MRHQNPFRTENGEPCSPSYNGFNRNMTGGGGWAWQKSTERYDVWVTDPSGMRAPEHDGGGYLMCGYDVGDGCRVELWSVEGPPSCPFYGLPRHDFVDDQWSALLGRIQKSVGVDGDGFASVFFDDATLEHWPQHTVEWRAEWLADYIAYEREWMDEDA